MAQMQFMDKVCKSKYFQILNGFLEVVVFLYTTHINIKIYL